MEEARPSLDHEVVHEAPVRCDGLRTNAGRPELDVLATDGRHVPLHIAHERPLGEIAPLLRGRNIEVPPGESPETAVGHCRRSVADVERGSAIPLAGEGKNGVRAGDHGAVNALREVDPEKREGWVR